MEKLLYTVAETAKILGFTDKQVRDWVEEGKLKEHRINGAGTKPLRITKDSIREFYVKHVIETPA